MKKSVLFKIAICFIFVFSCIQFSVFSVAKAATNKNQVGIVELQSGTLNVRSGPGVKYKRIGYLQNGTKVEVYKQIKNGWSEIRFKKSKAYVSSKYLRIQLRMSMEKAKSISDKVIGMQRKTWEKNYTKKQIYSIMAPGFTTAYIDRYFKQQMRKAGKDKSGTQLYHIIETEIWGYAIDSFDWEQKYQMQKPIISYYKKNGKEYLIVSQFLLNEESGDHTSKLYLSKSGPNKNWKVYKYVRRY